MAEDAGEKSQDPTAHRREEARKQGQVAQSQDLSSAALLLCGLIVLLNVGPPILKFIAQELHDHLGGDAWLSADRDFAVEQLLATTSGLARCMAPLFGMLLLLGLIVHWAQVGFLYLPEKLQPDINRLNPLTGFGRIFSISNVMRLAFGIFKIVVIGSVAYSILSGRRDEVLNLCELDLPQIAYYLWDISFWSCVKIAAALVILALLDYAYQRWKHEQELRMTTEEVREEMRNMQGDPQTIARRKSVQRALSQNRASVAVPKAEVVITNPTELAIAIEYNPTTMNAPIVSAKGAGLAAAKIRRLALEHNVPIVEKKPLAQALYKDVEIGQPIPDQMYAAVAEVLAYVYQLKGKKLPGAA